MQIKLDERQRFLLIVIGRKEFHQALQILQMIRGVDSDSVNRLVALSCRIAEIIDEDSLVERLNQANRPNLEVIDGGKNE